MFILVELYFSMDFWNWSMLKKKLFYINKQWMDLKENYTVRVRKK